MDEIQKRRNEIAQESGSSNWLTVIPVIDSDYVLNKQEFWDNIRLRYGWRIPGLPATCACGDKFTIQHAMSCKKGGFVNLHHNEARDITAHLLNEVCKHVSVEPTLLKMNGETKQAKQMTKFV